MFDRGQFAPTNEICNRDLLRNVAAEAAGLAIGEISRNNNSGFCDRRELTNPGSVIPDITIVGNEGSRPCQAELEQRIEMRHRAEIEQRVARYREHHSYTQPTYGNSGSEQQNEIRQNSHPAEIEPFNDCRIVEAKPIRYCNGTEAQITVRKEDQSVEEFVAADGVKYKRVDLTPAERSKLSSKLGHEPPEGYDAWIVENGGIGKSNGFSDKRIIAAVSSDPCGDVKISTLWPVPQETEYCRNGSTRHNFKGYESTTTVEKGSNGVSKLTQQFPHSQTERVIVSGKVGDKIIYDVDNATGALKDRTNDYALW